MSKKIGIIGSGVVAKTLGQGFVKHGYKVMLGTRDTSKLSDWAEETHAQIGSFSATAKFGELIILAVKGHAAQAALEMAGAENLNGKTIIDATNPIADEPPINGVLKFYTEQNYSLMEALQKAFPKAHFVKAFNSVGSALMVNPQLASKPTMFICGNEPKAKDEVSNILDLFGWEIADMGTAEAARAIEPLCILWCIPGFKENSWMHAFKLLK